MSSILVVLLAAAVVGCQAAAAAAGRSPYAPGPYTATHTVVHSSKFWPIREEAPCEQLDVYAPTAASVDTPVVLFLPGLVRPPLADVALRSSAHRSLRCRPAMCRMWRTRRSWPRSPSTASLWCRCRRLRCPWRARWPAKCAARLIGCAERVSVCVLMRFPSLSFSACRCGKCRAGCTSTCRARWRRTWPRRLERLQARADSGCV
jgi:hypothetical protein